MMFKNKLLKKKLFFFFPLERKWSDESKPLAPLAVGEWGIATTSTKAIHISSALPQGTHLLMTITVMCAHCPAKILWGVHTTDVLTIHLDFYDHLLKLNTLLYLTYHSKPDV